MTTGSVLHLVKPFGFELSDARLKRAWLRTITGNKIYIPIYKMVPSPQCRKDNYGDPI